tara:strand:- start:2689 stop:3525 length:837 start_codon:yes stop_codon:yes gene_type:complete
MDIQQQNNTLTRYLYNKTEVKHSLFIAILEHTIDEALFWGFELYYSGFEEDTIIFLQNIFITLFQKTNPSLTEYVDTCISKWNEINEPIYFGNLIATLCTRQYDLQEFCKTYFGVTGEHSINEKKHFIVSLDEEYIKAYQNNNSDILPRNILKTKCIYKIHKSFNTLFDIVNPSQFELCKRIQEDWLYYASYSPIWESRINQYNGIIDHENKRVVFQNDDDFENFYELWEYEPDEQGKEVFHNIIGYENEKQIGIKEFCNKYRFNLKTKKIKSTRKAK